jgi:hypothetical protein
MMEMNAIDDTTSRVQDFLASKQVAGCSKAAPVLYGEKLRRFLW